MLKFYKMIKQVIYHSKASLQSTDSQLRPLCESVRILIIFQFADYCQVCRDLLHLLNSKTVENFKDMNLILIRHFCSWNFIDEHKNVLCSILLVEKNPDVISCFWLKLLSAAI
jgi:hypothetical protein